ncbi:MAG: hypothetical protein LBK94_07445 [Prevotellaceae bacterium]|jgi:hypothetical protein|nr:hypothetical protein [Prevotellaceae bacterium]
MIKFFDYCFYRIATTKYFQKVDPKTPYIWAFGWTQFCELLNILTFINIYHLFDNSRYDYEIVPILICIPLSIINVFILLTKKKYNKSIAYYKDEKHKKLKGWGIFLYVIGSMLAFGYTGVKLFWVPVS